MKILFWIFSFTFFYCHGVDLSIIEKQILVNGKSVPVLALAQPDGTLGVRAKKGDQFQVLLKNTMNVPTSIHWHGIILPNSQDGVAFVTQFPQYPGIAYFYDFPLLQSGTYWMHSHFSLQEQLQLSAPLIIYDPDDAAMADQEAILFLSDFSFQSPGEIYSSLKCKKSNNSMAKHTMLDLNDVAYDAFLANYRTLENPEIITVEPGQKVRLRIINGASASNFFIGTGDLEGEAVAVDGNRIQPFKDSDFELAVAQRLDVIVTIPKEGGAFPILAKGEGTDLQTGVILATNGSKIPKPASKMNVKAGAFNNRQEERLHALHPLSKKPIDKQLTVELGGNMSGYEWTLNGQMWPEITSLVVEKGQRVEIVFKNANNMPHPMHLHGHVFQVTAINGKTIDGAMRDTVLIMPHSTLAIQFDAFNPGVWPLHCHILYHLEAGMFTVLRYKDFIQKL